MFRHYGLQSLLAQDRVEHHILYVGIAEPAHSLSVGCCSMLSSSDLYGSSPLPSHHEHESYPMSLHKALKKQSLHDSDLMTDRQSCKRKYCSLDMDYSRIRNFDLLGTPNVYLSLLACPSDPWTLGPSLCRYRPRDIQCVTFSSVILSHCRKL